LPSPDQVRNAPKPPAPPVKVDGQVASAPATAPTANAPIRVTPSSPATGGGKGFKIQLGAVRSEEAARIEWDKLRKTYAPVLGRLTLNIDKADLGVKGIYYRIQAGPFSDRAAADAACQELTKQKTPCLAIRPEG
jgi:cell division septation protein DedD